MDSSNRNCNSVMATAFAVVVLGLCAFGASAQTAPSTETQTAPAQDNVKELADSDGRNVTMDKPAPRVGCVRDTGSRIRQADKAASCKGPGRAYDRSDLERTGRTNLADQLRSVDPSIR